MAPDEWRAVHVGMTKDGLTIDGADIWTLAWRRTREPALQLPHPAFPDQLDYFDIYEADGPAGRIRFAAGELSGGVWGFYVPA